MLYTYCLTYVLSVKQTFVLLDIVLINSHHQYRSVRYMSKSELLNFHVHVIYVERVFVGRIFSISDVYLCRLY